MVGRRLALAKLAVSAVLIAVVVQAFDVRGLADRLAQVDIGDAALAMAVAIGIIPLQSLRWTVAIRESGNDLPFGQGLSIVWIGHFFSQVLPSSFGGDALRMWYAYRAGMAPGVAVTTVIADRAISLFGLLSITAAGLPWLLPLLPDPAARSAIVLVVAGGMVAFLAVAAIAGHPRLQPDWRVARMLLEPAALVRRILLAPRRLLPALALSIAGSAGFCLVLFELARALDMPLSMLNCLLLFPPVMLVFAIPVSVAGWGLREGAMVVALGFVGVPATDAFALSVLFGLLAVAMSLPGLVLWLMRGDASGSLVQAARMAQESAQD